MPRFALTLLCLLALASPAAAGMPGATPPAPGAPRFVQLTSIEGLPKETAARDAFLDAFRGTLATDEFWLEAEAARGNAVTQGERVPNHFRLLEGSLGDDVWTIQLVLGIPPLIVPAKTKAQREHPTVPRSTRTFGRASRGLTVVFTALSPEAIRAGARPMPTRLGLAFPDTTAVDHSSERITAGGYEYPWDEAGRATGLVALELLHRLAGEIKDTDRVYLGLAARRAEGAR